MFKKFLESFTLKDIIFIGIILILFLKMNRIKEKFSNTFTDQTDFETRVKDVLGDNVEAIKNLGDLSKKILDTPSNGTLDLSDINFKVKSLNVKPNAGQVTRFQNITNINKEQANNLCLARGLQLATFQDLKNSNTRTCGYGAWISDKNDPGSLGNGAPDCPSRDGWYTGRYFYSVGSEMYNQNYRSYYCITK